MELLQVKEALKNFLCDNLGVDANELEYDTQLFGEGIGLDSIDSIELVSFIEEEYKVPTSGIAKEVFTNIDTLAEYIVANAK
ncbi:MAG: acyl carrier protein [Acholeplasmatales bacterium]|nr:acyl carrier protein [Acholeplasmatales bacterium]